MATVKIVTTSRWVPMVGPDDNLDTASGWQPCNLLPAKCKHCSFPDINSVPKPYLLARGFSSPAETWSALCGNFLVRERVRKILELALPEACDFYPTAELKSKKVTPWILAVPKEVVPAPGLSLLSKEKCSKCKEPKLGYDSYDKDRRYIVHEKCNPKGVDLFKTREWNSRSIAEDRWAEVNEYRKQSGAPLMEWKENWGYVETPAHDERWTRQMLERELLFSVRLAQLWKAAKIKGKLVYYYYFKDFVPTPDDLEWVAGKMELLAKHKLVDAAPGGKAAGAKAKGAADKKASAAAEKWFNDYLKAKAKKSAAKADFVPIEKKHKVKLPKSYKEFVAKVGSKSFKDVNDLEGSITKILPPQKLDFSDYRRGALKDTDEDSAAIDGVAFAEVDSGDCFVFDVGTKGDDYPVYFYNHELNAMEPWSATFAECVKRFAEKN